MGPELVWAAFARRDKIKIESQGRKKTFDQILMTDVDESVL